jgi:hypothetical protein
MKHDKRKIHSRKTSLAMFAGTAALTTIAAQPAQAQSNVDALLNKLEQKGILTTDETKALREESALAATNNFNAEINAKFPVAPWVKSINFTGDFRGRNDYRASDNNAMVDRDMLRYRLRVGMLVNMQDDLQLGFRLGSGDSGNPLSNNQTLNGNASKKALYIDTAFGRWTPIDDGTWKLVGTIGKMDNPFALTPMVFDPDLTPEGAALQTTYNINDRNSLVFNGGAFVLDELTGVTRDPFMFGGQILWNSQWSSRLATSLGFSAFDIVNKETLGAAYDSNRGNTLSGGALVHNYSPLIADAGVTYTLESFPLYPGKFPIKLQAEYMNNPGANNNNNGYWAGVTFGKAGKKHTWDLSYRYEYLEADAWWSQVVDDDNAAFFPTSLTAGSFAGGTNIKGHLVKFNYSIFDSLTFSFSCYLNDLVNNPVPGAKNGAIHAMADLMWKF